MPYPRLSLRILKKSPKCASTESFILMRNLFLGFPILLHTLFRIVSILSISCSHLFIFWPYICLSFVVSLPSLFGSSFISRQARHRIDRAARRLVSDSAVLLLLQFFSSAVAANGDMQRGELLFKLRSFHFCRPAVESDFFGFFKTLDIF